MCQKKLSSKTSGAPGQKVGSSPRPFSLDGFFDDTDADQFASLGNERSVLAVPDGELAGDVAWVVPVAASGHALSGSIGDLLAFAYAAEGDGQTYRAQVMDIRENLQSDTNSTRLHLGPIPAGETLHVWVHANRLAGTLRVRLRSANSETNPTTTVRADSSNLTSTGLSLLSVDGPMTDEWWYLQHTITSSGDFDVAAASHFAAQMAVPIPVIPVIPPTPTTHTLLAGLSADAIPVESELSLTPDAGFAGNFTIQPFSNMHVLVARDEAEVDIASIVLSTDPTMVNQIAGFTKYGSLVNVSGTDYNVWVSNQALTISAVTTFEVR